MTTAIDTTPFAQGRVGQDYSITINVIDPPARAKIAVDGELPPGLHFESNRLVGKPTTAGAYVFTIAILDMDDNDNEVAAEEFTIRIQPAPAANTNTNQPARRDPKSTKKLITWGIIGLLVLLVVGYFGLNSLIKAVFPNAEPTAEPTAEVTEAPVVTEVTEAPVVTEVTEAAATPTPEPETTEVVATEMAADTQTDGKALAEAILGETLPNQPEMYSAGGDGFPEVCAGLCWDVSRLDQGIMKYYGPWDGAEDISQSDADFANGTGPLELMRTGKVTTVVFYLGKEAQLETCALGTLDGQPLSDILSVKAGECGKRVAIEPGWHVIQDNANSPIAGFGVRFSATGWAGMSEAQIVEYTGYWKISGSTATWAGPDGMQIMMVPSMVSMMQDFGTLTEVVFTTTESGRVLFCNGSVTGDATLSSKDGSCQFFTVPAGTFTYHGEDRLSAGISWNK